MSTVLSRAFPELGHLSREDLEDLLNDPAYFQAVFHSLNAVKSLYQAQTELGTANESIANNNLTFQDSLYKLRSETKDAFDEAKHLEARWKELEREQKEVYQRFTPQFLLMRLRHATTAQDDQSEALASAFVQSTAEDSPSSSKEIDEFVKEFKDMRKIYHKRVIIMATTTETLHSLLVSLRKPSPSVVRDTVNSLVVLEDITGDDDVLKRAIVDKLVTNLYAETLDTYSTEASDVEAEAEWWADTERSIAWYLLQTLPVRVLRAFQTRPVSSSSSLHHNNLLVVSLFPHLQYQPRTISFLYAQPQNASQFIRNISSFFAIPFDLARQECRCKRKELEKLRDRRAQVLGMLAELKGSLGDALEETNVSVKLGWFAHSLERLAQGQDDTLVPATTDEDVVASIQRLANTTLQSHKAQHATQTQMLRRPSRLILLWPRLLFLPPLTIYLLRTLYTSRTSLREVAKEVVQTVNGFVRGWLLEPLKDVFKTVRAGGEDGIIVKKEGIAADLDSLERMTLALAQDELHYGPEQLAVLARQIRLGDLTPILRIYEEDIKSPLKSAVTGTLLRSIFVQVQKAKVDIDQTLAGVDKLLKSQELTFAFVGVAPAFAIVYITGGLLWNLWMGGRGRGRYGGKRRRAHVWITMRRIERLLISQPKSSQTTQLIASDGISPLTSGLLLLSLAQLRRYAESNLPAHSHLREGFLNDVAHLEDPKLGRMEKIRVVDRMWKSWGGVLGWGAIAGE